MDVSEVLLFGNGILQAFSTNSVSWDELLQHNSVLLTEEENEQLKNVPFPLRVVLCTEDHVNKLVREEASRLYGEAISEPLQDFFRQVLDCGFSDILTTNYGYELESVCLNVKNISEYQLKKIQKHTSNVKRVDSKYLLHSFYQVKENGARIWHIHGEAKKKNSIILGHYYYGSLLYRYQAYLRERGNSYKDFYDKQEGNCLKSWLDSFILGNVYILGFGLDLSEMDIWWLINRKKNEKANHGLVYYYGFDDKTICKRKLLEAYGCRYINLDFPNDCRDYSTFYQKALKDIQERIKRRKQEKENQNG